MIIKNRLTIAVLALLAALPALAQEPKGLTAAIGTDGLVLHVGDEHCRVFVLLVNEGGAPAAVKDLAPKLLIDGKPAKGKLVDSFLQGDPVKVLAPGERAMWGAMLDLFVKEPGMHRISWKGRGFASNEAKFLLLPAQK